MRMHQACRGDSGKDQAHYQLICSISDLIRRIQRTRTIERVVLHGSYARGDIHDGSDIDLIIVGDFSERFHKRIIHILELTDLPVEPLCYTKEEFDWMVEHKNSFIMVALEEGIQLFPPDTEGIHDSGKITMVSG